MPYAYSDKTAERNAQTMMDALQFIQDKYQFNCDIGPIAEDLGYICPGNCMDYVYDVLRVPYAFAFEIWGPDAENKFKSFLQKIDENQEMFARYNPDTQQEYDWTIKTWTNAIYDLVKKIDELSQKLQNSSSLA